MANVACLVLQARTCSPRFTEQACTFSRIDMGAPSLLHGCGCPSLQVMAMVQPANGHAHTHVSSRRQAACRTEHLKLDPALCAGSRVHVYKFTQAGTKLDLQGDTFEQLKPGLSSFADDPQAAAESLQPLLDTAVATVPEAQRVRAAGHSARREASGPVPKRRCRAARAAAPVEPGCSLAGRGCPDALQAQKLSRCNAVTVMTA